MNTKLLLICALIFQTQAADLPLLTAQEKEGYTSSKSKVQAMQEGISINPMSDDTALVPLEFKSKKKTAHRITALSLPDEIWLNIMGRLDLKSFISTLDVNQRLRKLGSTDGFATCYKISGQTIPETLTSSSYLSTLNSIAIRGDKNAAGAIMAIVQKDYLKYRLNIPYFEGAVPTMIKTGWEIKSWREEARIIDPSLEASLTRTDYRNSNEPCITSNLLTENGMYFLYKLFCHQLYSKYISKRDRKSFDREGTPLHKLWTDIKPIVLVQHDILANHNYNVSMDMAKPSILVDSIQESLPLIQFIRDLKLLEKSKYYNRICGHSDLFRASDN